MTPYEALIREAVDMLQNYDLGDVGHSEYDAAWVARVPCSDRDTPEFPKVLDVVRSRQAPDGGWERDVAYVSTRIQTTLASCLALLQFRERADDLEQAQRGAQFVRRMWLKLDQDPEPALGFELVIAALIEEACRFGLSLHDLQEPARAIHAKKIKGITPNLIYSPQLSIGFSLEFVQDRLDAEKALQLRVANGSLGDSVAATAHHARITQDPTSRAFLRRIVDSYGPSNIPYAEGNLWGTIWALYNLEIAGMFPALRHQAAPHIKHIQEHVHEEGVSWSRYVRYGDGDDTAIGFYVLDRAGVRVNWTALRNYERPEGFLTFKAESHPSISTNANVLTAISRCPYEGSDETREKLIRLLVSWQNAGGFWTDKWHASPLYPTSRAIAALAAATRRSAGDLLGPSINWLMTTQRADGSWGFFSGGTPEETAYAIQGLGAAYRAGVGIDRDTIQRAYNYLESLQDPDVYKHHPKLWIAKGLYGPIQVIRSAVISAKAMALQILD